MRRPHPADHEGKFVPLLKKAFTAYTKGNGQSQTHLAQLQPYFESPVDEAILQRWEIAPASTIKSLGLGGDIVITQKDAVDDVYDTRIGIGPNGRGTTDFLSSRIMETMAPVFQAFQTANNGEVPEDVSLLRPYVTTPEQKAALEKMIQRRANEK